MTKKTFGRSFKCSFPDFMTIGDTFSLSLFAALAEASCTSNEEIVLSSAL
jgi:hypothetical protein